MLTLSLLFEDVMPNLFNVSSSDAAYKKSREFGDKIPIGFLYKVEKPTYDDSFEFLKNGDPLVDRKLDPLDAKKLMNDFI